MRRLGEGTELISVKRIIPCASLENRIRDEYEDYLKLDDIHGEIFTPIIVQPCSACSVNPSCKNRGEDLFGEVSGFRRLQKVLRDKGEDANIECYLASFENLEDMLLTNYRSDEERLEYNLYDKGRRLANMLKQLSSDKKRLSYRQLADKIHCDKSTIFRLLQMFKLAEENERYKKVLLMRLLTFDEAYNFTRLKEKEQKNVLDKMFSTVDNVIIEFEEEKKKEEKPTEKSVTPTTKELRKRVHKSIKWRLKHLRVKASYVKPTCPHCGEVIKENKELVNFLKEEFWEPLKQRR